MPKIGHDVLKLNNYRIGYLLSSATRECVPCTAAAQLIGVLLAKFTTPFADRLIGHHHAALQQYFFHIPEAQAEPEVQSHAMTDDCSGKAVVLVVGGRLVVCPCIDYAIPGCSLTSLSTS
jgi:hypothetical protein